MATKRLTAVDREALKRAFTAVYREDPEHLDFLVRQRGWQWAAESACYRLQTRALKLKPWQPPPSWVRDVEGSLAMGDDGIGGWYKATLLTQRLLAAGLSRFEPDPIGALERVEDAHVSAPAPAKSAHVS